MTAKKINIDPQVLASAVRRILPLVEEEATSAYGISKVLNTVLKANGLDPVRSQMMYNYAKNGLIVPGEKIAGATLRDFSKIEVAEFVAKYLLRNGVEIRTEATDAGVVANQLELELDN